MCNYIVYIIYLVSRNQVPTPCTHQVPYKVRGHSPNQRWSPVIAGGFTRHGAMECDWYPLVMADISIENRNNELSRSNW